MDPFAWNDMKQVIQDALVGDQSTWPDKVYNALLVKNYINFPPLDQTDEGAVLVTEKTIKETIQKAIDDFHDGTYSLPGSTLMMSIYGAMVDNSLIIPESLDK